MVIEGISGSRYRAVCGLQGKLVSHGSYSSVILGQKGKGLFCDCNATVVLDT